MVKYRIAAVLLAVSLIIPALASENYQPASEVSVVSGEISARAAILYNKNTGEVIFQKNSHQRLPIASTTKIMTAIVAMENSPVDSVVCVSREAVGVEGTSVYLREGEKMMLIDMIYALMLESANDAAVAIAIHVAGSTEAFVNLMNQKARELNLQNTNFANPHGLNNDNHYSSAYDMAKIFAYALDNPVFAKITSSKNYKVPLAKEGYRYFSNHNRLLSTLDGCIGGKTGFTKVAGRCLVSATSRDGLCMICVTLNAGGDWSLHKEMAEHGFSLYEVRQIAKIGEFHYNLPIVGGTHEYSTAKNEKELLVCVKKGSPPITHTIQTSCFFYAPVKFGQNAGRIVFKQNGKYIGEVEIFFENNVDIKPKKSFWSKIFGKR